MVSACVLWRNLDLVAISDIESLSFAFIKTNDVVWLVSPVQNFCGCSDAREYLRLGLGGFETADVQRDAVEPLDTIENSSQYAPQ